MQAHLLRISLLAHLLGLGLPLSLHVSCCQSHLRVLQAPSVLHPHAVQPALQAM